MRTVQLLAVPLIVLALSCAPTPEVDLVAEEEAIRQVSATWLEADRSQDAATVVSLFADDGAVYWEDRPPASGEALEAYFERFYADNPEGGGGFEPDEILVADSGDLAVEIGDYQAEGEVGRYATVHQKIDGDWKVRADFSVGTTPSGGAPPWARDLLETWYRAYNSRDAALLASTYAVDASIGDAEDGATGREAIAAHFEVQWADRDLECEGDFDEFFVLGPVATGVGRDRCVPADGGSGDASLSNWIAHYERQPDGSWLAVRDLGVQIGE